MPLDAAVRPRSRARSRSVAGLAARRMFDAQVGRRAAEKEWDGSLANAVKAGVIPDHRANPEAVGTNRVCYADDAIQVSLTVVEPIVGLNVPGFVAGLVKAGVDQKLLNRLLRRHRTETAAAHRFACAAVSG